MVFYAQTSTPQFYINFGSTILLTLPLFTMSVYFNTYDCNILLLSPEKNVSVKGICPALKLTP
jgi:hypothetical protein